MIRDNIARYSQLLDAIDVIHGVQCGLQRFQGANLEAARVVIHDFLIALEQELQDAWFDELPIGCSRQAVVETMVDAELSDEHEEVIATTRRRLVELAERVRSGEPMRIEDFHRLHRIVESFTYLVGQQMDRHPGFDDEPCF